MGIWRELLLSIIVLCLAVTPAGAGENAPKKVRVFVVSSYHREYVWSQDTNKGFCDAMLKFGYFDDRSQADEYSTNDRVETSRAVVVKMWMDAKRKGSKAELERAARAIYRAVKNFQPDLIFLGDDEAGEYIGKLYLDTKIPVVFWGFNESPVKYGLVDTAARPGHNVTGVYQSGYYVESLQFLKKLAPQVKSVAILSDTTLSGRTHYKALQYLAEQGGLPVILRDTVAVGGFEEWKAKALELQKKVDAFYVVSVSGFKDKNGAAVPVSEAIRWYTSAITIPEATRGHYVKDGLLCAADDSGYKQTYEAVGMAHDILTKKAKPATFAAKTPSRGALMANRARAKALGIDLKPETGVEYVIE